MTKPIEGQVEGCEKRFDERFKEQITGGDWHDYDYVAPQVKAFITQERLQAKQEELDRVLGVIDQYCSYYNPIGDDFNKGKHKAMEDLKIELRKNL